MALPVLLSIVSHAAARFIPPLAASARPLATKAVQSPQTSTLLNRGLGESLAARFSANPATHAVTASKAPLRLRESTAAIQSTFNSAQVLPVAVVTAGNLAINADQVLHRQAGRSNVVASASLFEVMTPLELGIKSIALPLAERLKSAGQGSASQGYQSQPNGVTLHSGAVPNRSALWQKEEYLARDPVKPEVIAGKEPVKVPALEGRQAHSSQLKDNIHLAQERPPLSSSIVDAHQTDSLDYSKVYPLVVDGRVVDRFVMPHELIPNELVRQTGPKFLVNNVGMGASNGLKGELTYAHGPYMFASVPNRTQVAPLSKGVQPPPFIDPKYDQFHSDVTRRLFPITRGYRPLVMGTMEFDNGVLKNKKVEAGSLVFSNRKEVNGRVVYENIYPGDMLSWDTQGTTWQLLEVGRDGVQKYKLRQLTDASGRPVEQGLLGIPRGGYSAVQLEDGRKILTKKNHMAASGGGRVAYAMTLHFDAEGNGSLLKWTNETGHYQTQARDAGVVGLPHFQSYEGVLEYVYGPIKGWYASAKLLPKDE